MNIAQTDNARAATYSAVLAQVYTSKNEEQNKLA